MATTKKPAAPVVAKVVPTVSAKPAVKAVAVAAKPVEPKAAPAAKKVVAKPAAPKAAAPVAKPKAVAKSKAKTNGAAIDPGQRDNYIEVAAFYIAERRGFTPGNPEQDYLDAAAEIDRLIGAGHFGK